MALEEVGVKLVLDPGSFYADLGKTTKGIGDLGDAAKDAAQGLGAVGKPLDDIAAKAQAAGLKFDEASGRWRTATGQFASNAQLAALGIKKIPEAAEKAGPSFHVLEEIAIGSLRRIGEAAVEAGAMAVQAMARFVGDSISVAGDFEGAVNNLAAVSGDALAEAGFSFDDVSQKALQLGIDTRYSASESISAMTELVKGGVPVAEVMADATDNTLALAAATGIELGSAAEIVAKQFGVWSETGVTTANVVDLITQASNASTVGAEDLALGLAQSGGTAKTAGVEFSDLVQSMALISPNFSSASDAGTSFKTFLTRLIPSTQPATDAMIALGLATEDGKSKFYDANGAFIGMEQAAALLQERTAGLTEEQRLSAFQTIFGADAIRAASAIATAGAEGFNAMGESMASAGSAAETAAIQNQGWNFIMDSLKGSMETLQIVIGSALLPILTQLVNDVFIPGVGIITSFAQALFGNQEAFASLSPLAQQLVTTIQGIATAFTTAGPLSQEFAASLGALSPVLPSIVSGISQVVSFLQNNWQSAVTVAGGVLTALLVPALAAGAAAFGAAVVAAAPVIGVLALVGGAAAALYGAWQQNFGGIQQATSGAMTAIQAVIQSVLSVILTFWQNNGAEIMAFAQQAWTQVQQIIGNVVAIIATIVSTVFGGIAQFINEHGAEIQMILEVAWSQIQSIIDFALNTIQGITTVILGLLTGDWEKASSGIQQIVEGLWEFIQSQFENIVRLIQGLGPVMLDAALTIGQAIIDGIVSGIQTGSKAVADAAMSIARSALEAAKSFLGISSPSQEFADAIGLPIPEGIAVGMIAGVGAPITASVGIASAIGSTLQQAVDPAVTIGAALSANLAAGIAAGASAATTAATDMSAAVNAALTIGIEQGGTQAAGAAVTAAESISSPFCELIPEGVECGKDQIKEGLKDTGSELDDFSDKTEQWGTGIAEGIGESIGQGAQELATQVQGVVSNIERTWGKITQGVTQLGTDTKPEAESTGEAISQGIADAIDANTPAIADAARSAAEKALSEAKAALGISSPSTVFAAEVGYPMAQGAAQGILDGLPVVIDAIGALADEIEGEANEIKEKAVKAFEDIGNATAKAFDEALGGQVDLLRTRQRALKDIGKFQDELEALRAQVGTGETAEENTAIERRYQKLYANLSNIDKLRVEAQNEAAKIAKVDATAANDYLALRENQFVKILALEEEYDKAATTTQRARAGRSLELEREAQKLELEQFRIAMEKRQKETASLGADAELTGDAIVDGMIKGIQERSTALAEALGAVMGSALKTAQKQLGISSPSMVFATQVGMPISEGIAMGVSAAMPVALSAVSDMASALVRPAAPAMARGGSVSGSITNNYNYAPQYQGAPRQPSQDFRAMAALSTAR